MCDAGPRRLKKRELTRRVGSSRLVCRVLITSNGVNVSVSRFYVHGKCVVKRVFRG